MSIWVEIVFGLILLSTIVLVIAENKHPVKTLAWLMVLVFLPVVGLVIYFLFGIDKNHRRLVSDVDLRRLKSHTESLMRVSIQGPEGFDEPSSFRQYGLSFRR